MEQKDYLVYENGRNKMNRRMYEDILRCCFGSGDAVLIAHHLTFTRTDGTGEPDEIPSADAMIFDHDVMSKVFPENYKEVLAELAVLPVPERDVRLNELFYAKYPKNEAISA